MPDEDEFVLESYQDNFSLNPNEDIILLFNDSALENDNYISNTNFNLEPPYPNPFNPNINFELNVFKMENIRINIYDIKGNQIETVFSGLLAEGNYTFN